jgi:hypothetical protein
MNQDETWRHMKVKHTRNIAVGSTAIRQATCPIVYGEVLWWCPIGAACSSADDPAWTWHSRSAAAIVQTSRMARIVKVFRRITDNTTHLFESA